MSQSALQTHLSLLPDMLSDQSVPTAQKLEAAPMSQALPPGRLVELSGVGAVGRTSAAINIVKAVQAQGDTAAWIQVKQGGLYPPDLAEAQIDLHALLVVHVPARAGVHARLRAAELLLRSGALGLLVIDLDDERPSGPPAAWQGRLLGLARQHDSRVVLLSRSRTHQGSLGPLIGLRFELQRKRVQPGVFELAPHLLKNKSGAMVQLEAERFRGPWGLR